MGEWPHREYSAALGAFVGSDLEPIATERNAARFPVYHRLDVSVRWRFGVLGGVLEPYLSVANLYNRKNVFVYFFDYNSAPPRREGLSQLPLAPSFGLEFSW